MNPFPGASFGINHFFTYIAQAMVAAFDQSSLDNLLQLLKTAGDNTPMPSLTAPVQILCYFFVQALLGLLRRFCSSSIAAPFILYGVTALFGPVFIPLLMTRTFRGKFFHFLDVLISFAMIRAVAAAFIFVWAGFMNAFIQQTFNGNYSMEMWLANLIPCTMVFIAFIINMLFIPSMTQAIFGGAAGMADSVSKVGGSGCFHRHDGRRSVEPCGPFSSAFCSCVGSGLSQAVPVRCSLCFLIGLFIAGSDLHRDLSSHAVAERSQCPPCPRTLYPLKLR